MYLETLDTVVTDLPVTVDEVKAHMIVDHTDDDVLINQYIEAAVAYAEVRTELSLRIKRYRVFGTHWPDCVSLMSGPIREIETVRYLDGDDAVVVVPKTSWGIYNNLYGKVLEFYEAPPAVGSTRRDAVMVEYLAGYGTLPVTTADANGLPYTLTDTGFTAIPPPVRQGLYMLIGHWYENRETMVVGTSATKLVHAADDLFHSVRVMGT